MRPQVTPFLNKPERLSLVLHSWVGSNLACKKIGLGWKGLPGTNTLAYYEKVQLTAVRSFITLPPVITLTTYGKMLPTIYSNLRL